MKKILFASVVLLLACVSMNAQSILSEEELIAKHYTPHVVDMKNLWDVGLGLNFGTFTVDVMVGYNFSRRLNAVADLSLGSEAISLLATGNYMYEAIPSIRGGFYFNLGITAGLLSAKDQLYYSYDTDETTYSRLTIPFLGPSISFKHHIFDHFAIGARGSYNLLTLIDEFSDVYYGQFLAVPFLIYQF